MGCTSPTTFKQGASGAKAHRFPQVAPQDRRSSQNRPCFLLPASKGQRATRQHEELSRGWRSCYHFQRSEAIRIGQKQAKARPFIRRRRWAAHYATGRMHVRGSTIAFGIEPASASALPATPEPSDIVTPSESVTPAGETLSNILTDDAGYRTRAVVTNMQVSTTSDVANQKPGRAEVTVQLSADAVLTNLTPKHNVTSSGTLGVLPAWKRKSPPCAASVRQAARSSFEAITIGGANQWNDEATEFCVLRGLWAAPGKNGALEPNESRSLALAQNLASASGGYPPERVQVPEENLERVEAALNKPDFWIMMRYIGDYDVTNADGVCRDSSGAIAVVATTAGGKGLCSRIVTDGTR